MPSVNLEVLEGQVALITLNRPGVLDALDKTALDELLQAVREVSRFAERAEVRAIGAHRRGAWLLRRRGPRRGDGPHPVRAEHGAARGVLDGPAVAPGGRGAARTARALAVRRERCGGGRRRGPRAHRGPRGHVAPRELPAGVRATAGHRAGHRGHVAPATAAGAGPRHGARGAGGAALGSRRPRPRRGVEDGGA